MVRITEIRSGSIAEALELRVGTRIVRINGAPVRDGLDFTFLTAESDLELEAVDPNGETIVYEIERDPSEDLGLIPAPDKVRECANKCVFCFIDGNPPDARDPLWLRDDDFRLSFTYGSYVTLTNLGPRGIQRLVDQRLSPLYVSVHATDPETRVRLLVNRRAGRILEDLQILLDGGLEVHTQVVLCPGWNDGEHLDRTIDDLYAMGDGILSLSVVPVGLTKYNLGRPVRHLTPEEVSGALRQVDRARTRALKERGKGWCYAADEMFLISGIGLPSLSYYDDAQLLENGVGAVRQHVDGLDAIIPDLRPLKDVDRVRVVTGGSMAPLFGARHAALESALKTRVDIVNVRNRYFGETVTVAGLLPGKDIEEALHGTGPRDVVLLPAEALNGDRLFIDGLPLADLERRLAPSRIVPAFDLPEALSSI